MRPSILRSTAVLGGATGVQILAALAAAKVWALLLGPGGYGLLALWQAMVRILAMAAAMGLGVGLVRLGANAISRGDVPRMDHLRRAAWVISWVAGGLVLSAIVWLRVSLARWALDRPAMASEMVWVGVAVLLTVLYGTQTGLLNAYHRVGALARITAIGSVSGAAAGICIIAVWREAGIPAAIVAAAAANCATAQFFVRRLERPAVPAAPGKVLAASGELLRFGGLYAAAMLLGTGVQLALPFLVLHLEGLPAVGFYRAAAAMAVTYLTVLLTALGQDYFPRLSAVSHDGAEMVRLINEQHRMLLLLALPVILAALALAPIAVPLLYSSRFLPAVVLLEWILLGDVLKVASWTMSFAILARCSGWMYLLTEAVGGAALVAAAFAGMRWWGLVGAGIAFPITYAVYYVVVRVCLRRSLPLTFSRQNTWLLLGGILAVGAIRLLGSSGWAGARTPVALALAAGAAVVAWVALRRAPGTAEAARA